MYPNHISSRTRNKRHLAFRFLSEVSSLIYKKDTEVGLHIRFRLRNIEISGQDR